MPRTEPRRTQQERSEATRAALIGSARELFAQDGYAATSLDAVVARAGVTKGALYHHYAGKRELFAAVVAGEQERLAGAVAAAYGRRRDPWDGFEAGCRAFLGAVLDPGVQRIVLHDAPGALGWQAVRELEAGLLAMLESGIRRAIEARRIASRPPGPLASLLFGALCESAMVVARSGDQQAAQRESVAELRRLLRALRR